MYYTALIAITMFAINFYNIELSPRIFQFYKNNEVMYNVQNCKISLDLFFSWDCQAKIYGKYEYNAKKL